MHRNQLLAPAVIHLVVGPDRRARIARALARLLDVAAKHARAHVPARVRSPVVVHAEYGGFAIEIGAIDMRRHETQILLCEVTHHAQRTERAADGLTLVGAEHAVL